MNWEGSLRNVAKKCNSNAILEIINSVPDSQWKADTEKRDSNKTHGTTRALFLKYKNQNYEKTDVTLLQKLKPYLDEIISQVKEFYGYQNLQLTRMIVTELPKGSIIPEHVDEGEMLSTNHRVHIPLLSDPAVKFMLDHQDHYLEPGNGYEINNQLVHGVRNESNINRLHMIIDLKEWTDEQKTPKWWEVDLEKK